MIALPIDAVLSEIVRHRRGGGAVALTWTAAVLLGAADATRRVGRCPRDMAPVDAGRACIDRYEASVASGSFGAPDGSGTTAVAASRRGAAVAQRVSFAQAARACGNAGKRLCTAREWLGACGGSAGRPYAYGETYEPGRCNDRDAKRPRGPPAVVPAGRFPGCRNPDGAVYDLSGNVWEWVDEDKAGGLRAACGGGFANTAMDLRCACSEGARPDRALEGVGFRCCRAANR